MSLARSLYDFLERGDGWEKFRVHRVGAAAGDAPAPSVDVVLLHGLGGDYVDTWLSSPVGTDKDAGRAANTAQFWPASLATVGNAAARVLLVEYPTGLLRLRKDEVSLMGGHVLNALRAVDVGRRPILFLAHSLGGIVLKQTLVADAEPDEEALCRNCVGVSFFGTPHKGSLVASLAKLTGLGSEQLKSLGRDFGGEQLSSLHRAFLRNVVARHPRLHICNYTESNFAGIGEKIVDDDSASGGFEGYPQVTSNALPADHMAMVKFDRENLSLTTIRDQLADWLGHDAKPVPIDGNDAPSSDLAKALARGVKERRARRARRWRRLGARGLLVLVVTGLVACGGYWANGVAQAGFATLDHARRAASLLDDAERAREDHDPAAATSSLRAIAALSRDGVIFDLPSAYRLRGVIESERALAQREAGYAEEWEQVISPLRIYLDYEEDDDDARLMLARALRETYAYVEAEHEYRQVLEHNEENWEALSGLSNCLRRQAVTHREAGGAMAVVANRQYREGLEVSRRMQTLAGDDPARQQRALGLQAKLFWQMEHHEQARTLYLDIIRRWPSLDWPIEDLAQVELELWQRDRTARRAASLASARARFAALYDRGVNQIFVGTGLAEATAEVEGASPADLDAALTAGLHALNAGRTEDPYAYYAVARVYHARGESSRAIEELGRAIRYERERASNPHTFDYVRLRGYEARLDAWCTSAEPVLANSPTCRQSRAVLY